MSTRTGAPEQFPERIDPMLARTGKLPADEEDWGFEIKWDGVRALAYSRPGEWFMLSRRGEDVSARYPEMADLSAELGDRAAVLDGEIVALDEGGVPSFQRLQRRMGLTAAKAVEQRVADTPITYMVFDVLHLDGGCSRDLPYAERRALLESLGLAGAHWQTPPNHLGGANELLEVARTRGLEGIVAKRLDSSYRPGKRSSEWIKHRIRRGQEFVIGGYLPGEGGRSGRLGSLLVGYWDTTPEEAERRDEPQRLVYAGGVGTGFTQALLKELTEALDARRRDASPFELGGGPRRRGAVWTEPELVGEVEFSEWTHEGTLRQPAFKGLRDDKDPREVVREA